MARNRLAQWPAAWLLGLFLLGTVATAAAEDRFCENGRVTIDARYDGGNFHRCKFRGKNTVELTIRKEDKEVVVDQPWFSFRVTASKPTKLKVRLKFPEAYARYWPKLSNDGATWRRADESAVTFSKSRKKMELVIDVASLATWVSAQEVLTAEYYDKWLQELAAHDDFTVSVIGKTVNGRSIHLARTANKPGVIVLLGRQHPAEVPGAIAMREFVDVVAGDTELARTFRERFTLLIVPFLNPDGVAKGHWRHNARRTDLNRDWGPFTQPETQSVAKLLDDFEELDMRPRLMLDFHATKFTDSMLFYTQREQDATDPHDFANIWLQRVRERAPHYDFIHDPRPTSAQPNTKGYFYTRYGIPSFTYEVGDEADRAALIAVTPVFAEEMMRTMLDSEP